MACATPRLYQKKINQKLKSLGDGYVSKEIREIQ
jgi:hypothetical protein